MSNDFFLRFDTFRFCCLAVALLQEPGCPPSPQSLITEFLGLSTPESRQTCKPCDDFSISPGRVDENPTPIPAESTSWARSPNWRTRTIEPAADSLMTRCIPRPQLDRPNRDRRLSMRAAWMPRHRRVPDNTLRTERVGLRNQSWRICKR